MIVGDYISGLGGYVFFIENIGGTDYAYIVAPQPIQLGTSGTTSSLAHPGPPTWDFGGGNTLELDIVNTYFATNSGTQWRMNTDEDDLVDLNANQSSMAEGNGNHNLWVAHHNSLETSYESSTTNYEQHWQGFTAVMQVETYIYDPNAEITDWFLPNKAQMQKLAEFCVDREILSESLQYYADAWAVLQMSTGLYHTTTEHPTNNTSKVYAQKMYNNNTSYTNAGQDIGQVSINKTELAYVRAIRKIAIPPEIKIVDSDDHDITDSSHDYHLFQFFNVASDPVSVQGITIPGNDGLSDSNTFWCSSFIKFTSLGINTAEAVFSSIPNIVLVEFTDYTQNGNPTTTWYKDSSLTSTLTTLIDGGVYRISRDSNAEEHTFSIVGDQVLTSSNAVGYDFSIVNGDSYLPWPINKTKNIEDLFGGDNTPDSVTSYQYGVCHTADLPAINWGVSGLIGTSEALDSSLENTNKIDAVNQSAVAANSALNLSVVQSGVTYDDWVLPSKKLLERLLIDEAGIGGFNLNSLQGFWSSTEDNRNMNNAWVYGNRGFESLPRSMDARVRPVRYVESTSNFNLGSSNLGGTIFYKQEIGSQSKINVITDDLGNTWIPGVERNRLTQFSPGKAYHISSNGSFTFTELLSSSIPNASPVSPDSRLAFNQMNPPSGVDFSAGTMYMSIKGGVLKDAISQITAIPGPLVSAQITTVNLFASLFSQVQTFKNSYGTLITHQTLMAEIDTYEDTAVVYNNAQYQSVYNARLKEIKASTLTYRVLIKSSNGTILGGAKEEIPLPYLDDQTYSFKVRKPDHQNNQLNFVIFGNGNEYRYTISGRKDGVIYNNPIKFDKAKNFTIIKTQITS